MKTCPVCALELEDSYLFCPDDGSSLAANAGDFSFATPVSTDSLSKTQCDDGTTHVVLYCPACGAEYPLTFSSCPVHGLQLTKQRIQRLGKKAAIGTTDLHVIAPPYIESRHGSSDDISGESTGGDLVEHEDKHDEFAAANSRAIGACHSPEFLSEDREPEQQGLRIAAIATMIALAVFALVGLYALISNLSRRPSPAARTASQTETAQAVPFVVTPQEAQDYKEEQPAASNPADSSQSPAPAQVVDSSRKEIASSTNEKRDRKAAVAPPVSTPQATTAPAATVAHRASDVSLGPLPPANSSEFDSRLVRARANKTSAGYRYDLTFNMQEQRGRSAQWQRVLITTRAASGSSHTQAIPFVHRLGATGALTFTISIELTGRSEADWRGRINCTTLGWDNAGAPLQATFAANVTP
jgi:hypothetical protein